MGKAFKKTKAKSKISIKAPKNLPIWFVILLFLVTTFIFFSDQIFQHSFFWEDFVEYVYPTQNFAAKSFARGEIPFWNSYSFGGMPFYSDIQVGFFYLFNRILTLFTFSDSNLPVFALELMIILHFLFAQINMYFFARHLKISSYGAIIAAISYSFSMIMVGHTIHPMLLYHFTWFPLVALLIMKSFKYKKVFYSIFAGLVLGLTLLSGHPQGTLYIIVLLFIIIVYELVFFFKEDSTAKQIPKAILIVCLPFAIAFGIFAVQYFPSKSLSEYSIRSTSTYTDATEGSLQFKQIYTAIVPKLFGWVEGSNLRESTFYLKFRNELKNFYFWETAYYFGLASAILGLFAVLWSFTNRYCLLFVLIGVFSFLFALGDSSPIYGLFYNLPFFGLFRNPSRMMIGFVFAITILGGFGFDLLWKEGLNKKIMWFLFIPLVLGFVIAFLAYSGAFAKIFEAPFVAQKVIEDSGSFAIMILVGIGAIAILLNRAVISPSLAGFLLIILTYLDLYLVGSGFNRNPNNPEDYYKIKPELKALLTPKIPDDIFRVNMRIYEPISFMAMQRNQGLFDDIMLIEGYNPLVLKRVLPPISDAKTVLDLLNVKYEVKVDLEKSTWAFVERNSYFPRIWLVNQYAVVPSDKVYDFMKNNNFDYKNSVILEEAPKQSYNSMEIGQSTAKLSYFSNNYISFEINAQVPVIAVLSEIWYPDWKAYLDGTETKIYRANYSLRAVEIPQGMHRLELCYESDAFRKGAIVSISTLFLVLVLLIISYRLEIAKHIHIEEHLKG